MLSSPSCSASGASSRWLGLLLLLLAAAPWCSACLLLLLVLLPPLLWLHCPMVVVALAALEYCDGECAVVTLLTWVVLMLLAATVLATAAGLCSAPAGVAGPPWDPPRCGPESHPVRGADNSSEMVMLLLTAML